MKIVSHFQHFVAIVVSMMVASLTMPTQLRAQEPAGQAVMRLENTWVAAEAKHDAAAIGKLLAEGFTFVHPDGRLLSKAQLLAEVAADTTTIQSEANSELKPRVYGSTVVITGVATQTVKTKAGSELRRYRWTDTWVKGSDGQWLCVAGQSIQLAKK